MGDYEAFAEYTWNADCKKMESERIKRESSCKHKWHEEEMRGFNKSKFFCTKCGREELSPK